MSPHSVFKDESKLDINFIPNRLPHREKEHRLLMEFFGFLLRCPDQMTQRVIITGDVGTGKTAIAHRFGADITLEGRKRKLNVRYIHINCREYRGNLLLIIQHAVAVFRPTFPKRGFSEEEILSTLSQCLDEENAYAVLTLDEFDTLIEREGSEAVYKLTRLQEMRPGKPQRISLIGIIRDLGVLEKLDASARSTLQRNILSLEKYSESQLADILDDRVFMAFEPSAVPEDTVSLIAELARSESGNARFAIELLWRAGKYADSEEAEMVSPEYVRKAISNIFPIMKKAELDGLGLHERLFLLGATRYFKQSEKAYASLSEIEKNYIVVCEELGEEPNSHTQLWKYAQFLSALGFLKTEVATLSPRGRSTKISLPSISASELEKDLCASLERQL